MNDERVIETEGITRRFGKLTAVDGVDLGVHRGEVFGFLGPNGAGKSTLIRMLVGLMSPSEGKARVLGCELPRDAEKLRTEVGYMTQKFSLYEDLTIEENLQFAAEIFGLEKAQRRIRVDEVLSDFELAERRQQSPRTLSGGWKQRLALAAATIHKPALLVLDEPTAGVDPDRRRAFWEQIFELAAEGATVLVSTHYMDEAVRCHRVAMLIRGRLVAVGEPAALIDALDGRVIEVESTQIEQTIPTLRALPKVASVTQLGSRVHVLLERDGAPASEMASYLGAELRRAGLEESRSSPAEPTLEDVFVALSLGESLTTGASQ
jgi:ABC-2 type transport system ATP-binding protein